MLPEGFAQSPAAFPLPRRSSNGTGRHTFAAPTRGFVDTWLALDRRQVDLLCGAFPRSCRRHRRVQLPGRKMGRGRWNHNQRRTSFRSFAVCQSYSCGKYRYHDILDPTKPCLCGTEWAAADLQKARWYREEAEKKQRQHRPESGGDARQRTPSAEALLEQLRTQAKEGGITIHGLDLEKAHIERQEPEEKPYTPLIPTPGPKFAVDSRRSLLNNVPTTT